MSGGSYNYIGREYVEVDDLAENLSDIKSMHTRLKGLGYPVLALYTAQILHYFDSIKELHGLLHEAWHAVEWCDSCDMDSEDMKEILDEKEGEYSSDPRRETVKTLFEINAKVKELYKALQSIGTPVKPSERIEVVGGENHKRPDKDWDSCPYASHADDCNCQGMGGDR